MAGLMQHIKLNPVNCRIISKSSVNTPDLGEGWKECQTSAIHRSVGCKITVGGKR